MEGRPITPIVGSNMKSSLLIKPDQASRNVKKEMGTSIFNTHINPFQPFASPEVRLDLSFSIVFCMLSSKSPRIWFCIMEVEACILDVVVGNNNTVTFFHKLMFLPLSKESSQQGFSDVDGAIRAYFQTAETADTGVVFESNPLDMMIDGLGRATPPALTA